MFLTSEAANCPDDSGEMIRLVREGEAPKGAKDNARGEPAMGVATGKQGSMPSSPKAKRLGSSKLMAALQGAGFSRAGRGGPCKPC